MELDDLQRVFGGVIRRVGTRHYLDTHVGDLRTFVIERDGAFVLAVVTPTTREVVEPFAALAGDDEWMLDGEHRAVPRMLSAGFMFSGCRRGILFARNKHDIVLEDMVSALWELARWAHEPWRPRGASDGMLPSMAYEEHQSRTRVALVMLIVAFVILSWLGAGCAMSTDLGVIQHVPAKNMGASSNVHLGLGDVVDRVAAISIDLRGDVASANSRFAVGASALGGLPVGPIFMLGRAGIWRALTSSTDERAVVPTFELAAMIPTVGYPIDKQHPQYGVGYGGVVIGIREDLDVAAYTTVFVGYALMFVPGY